MEKQNQIDLYVALFAGVFLFTILSVSIIYFFIQYRKRLFKKHTEMLKLESKHKEDLLFSSITSAEIERKRMAADIHDELGSIFVNLSYSIINIEKHNAGLLQHTILDSKGLIEKGLNSVRRISHSIMPPELELYGLVFTIENFCEKLNAAEMGVTIDFNSFVESISMTETTSLALYRILQELTTNTLKHAGASIIDIQLYQKETNYFLNYKDNGRGLDLSGLKAISGLGFKNIESRVQMINGKIHYTTSPSNGFSCQIILPNS